MCILFLLSLSCRTGSVTTGATSSQRRGMLPDSRCEGSFEFLCLKSRAQNPNGAKPCFSASTALSSFCTSTFATLRLEGSKLWESMQFSSQGKSVERSSMDAGTPLKNGLLLRAASSASDSLTLYKLGRDALPSWLKLLSLRLGQREACQLSKVAELWLPQLLVFLLHA